MNKEKQRIKIAEVCKWEPQTICTDFMGNPWPDSPPDYLNDLNAMHEAEKVLTQEQTDKYVTTLCLEVQPEPLLHHATAAQRAEAFLKTLGLWEDAK